MFEYRPFLMGTINSSVNLFRFFFLPPKITLLSKESKRKGQKLYKCTLCCAYFVLPCSESLVQPPGMAV